MKYYLSKNKSTIDYLNELKYYENENLISNSNVLVVDTDIEAYREMFTYELLYTSIPSKVISLGEFKSIIRNNRLNDILNM